MVLENTRYFAVSYAFATVINLLKINMILKSEKKHIKNYTNYPFSEFCVKTLSHFPFNCKRVLRAPTGSVCCKVVLHQHCRVDALSPLQWLGNCGGKLEASSQHVKREPYNLRNAVLIAFD